MKTSILLVLFTLSSTIAKKKMTEQFGIANQAENCSNYEAYLLATKNCGVKKFSMGLLKVAAIGVHSKRENSNYTLIYTINIYHLYHDYSNNFVLHSVHHHLQ